MFHVKQPRYNIPISISCKTKAVDRNGYLDERQVKAENKLNPYDSVTAAG